VSEPHMELKVRISDSDLSNKSLSVAADLQMQDKIVARRCVYTHTKLAKLLAMTLVSCVFFTLPSFYFHTRVLNNKY